MSGFRICDGAQRGQALPLMMTIFTATERRPPVERARFASDNVCLCLPLNFANFVNDKSFIQGHVELCRRATVDDGQSLLCSRDRRQLVN